MCLDLRSVEVLMLAALVSSGKGLPFLWVLLSCDVWNGVCVGSKGAGDALLIAMTSPAARVSRLVRAVLAGNFEQAL